MLFVIRSTTEAATMMTMGNLSDEEELQLWAKNLGFNVSYQVFPKKNVNNEDDGFFALVTVSTEPPQVKWPAQQ